MSLKLTKKKVMISIILVVAIFSVYITVFDKEEIISVSKTIISSDTNQKTDFFINDMNYEISMMDTIIPYTKKYEQTGYFEGAEKLKIFYRSYKLPESKASVVISHGWTESSERFLEVIYYFLKSGYSVYAVDHRGHGYSGRLGKDKYMVNVEQFEYYISDFKNFLDKIVKPDEPQKLFLYAHSMGGTIGTAFLEANTGYFDLAVLASPMLEVKTNGIPPTITKAIASAVSFIGFDKEYCPGHGPFDGQVLIKNETIQSKPRNIYIVNQQINNTALQSGGASYNWLYESLDTVAEITEAHNIKKVKTPVLLIQAEKDQSVLPNGQNKFAMYAPECKMVVAKDASHNIYMEEDKIFKPYMESILSFYQGK